MTHIIDVLAALRNTRCRWRSVYSSSHELCLLCSTAQWLLWLTFFYSAVPEGILAVQNILTHLDIGARHCDCGVVIRVCEAVSRRAAHICAAGQLVCCEIFYFFTCLN